MICSFRDASGGSRKKLGVVGRLDDNVKRLEVRFVDGTAAEIVNSSVSALVLDGVFLRFALAFIIIYALLDQSPWNETHFAAGELAALWLVLTVETLLWYFLALTVVKKLWFAGLITTVYTPFIILPSLVFFHSTTFFFASSLHATSVSMSNFLSAAAADVGVLLTIDFLFGNFAAPRHPSFRMRQVVQEFGPDTQLNRAIDDVPLVPNAGAASGARELAFSGNAPVQMPRELQNHPQIPAPAPQHAIAPTAAKASAPDSIRLGGETFAHASIQVVRAEDHYLHIITTDRRLMVRGEISRVTEALKDEPGFLINRSVWIAFDQVEQLVKTSATKLELAVAGGDVLAVSKYRRVAFLDQYRRYLDAKGQVVPWATGSKPAKRGRPKAA